MARVTTQDIKGFFKEKHLFNHGDLITIQNIKDIRKFRKGGGAVFGKIFEPAFTIDNVFSKWDVEVKCSSCGEVNIQKLSKTKLLEYIIKNELVCETCKKKIEQKIGLENKVNLEKHRESIKKSTENFIENYLNPSRMWNKGMSVNEKFYNLRRNLSCCNREDITEEIISHLRRNLSCCNREDITEEIISMDYQDFLKTPYWKAVALALKVKQNARFKCKICGSNEGLSTHHNTYEHHGAEVYYLEDLICICQSCHQLYHDNQGEG